MSINDEKQTRGIIMYLMDEGDNEGVYQDPGGTLLTNHSKSSFPLFHPLKYMHVMFELSMGRGGREYP